MTRWALAAALALAPIAAVAQPPKPAYVTGSPTTGALAKASGPQSLTTGDLSGDCSTSATLATICLKTNGVSFGSFATQNYATPPAIGGTTPAAGAFTTLGATGNLTTNITGATQCVQANSSGVLAGTGSACGAGGGGSTLVAPQGRLTLVSATPVMTSDQTAKSTVYYDCFAGNVVTYYTGSADAADAITSCEVSLTMATSGTGVTNSGGVFDIAWDHTNGNICVVTNGSGGGWASDTGGSNTVRGSGYSAVHNTRGYYTFSATTAHCYHGATDYGSAAADRRTYLGSLYTTAAGQTGFACHPAGASGGAAPVIGLFNAYNRVPFACMNIDSAASWTTTSTAWTTLHASTSDRVSWVDGLGVAAIAGTMGATTQASFAPASCLAAMLLDATSGTPNVSSQASGTLISGQVVADNWSPQTGFHYIQEMEATDSVGATCTYYVTASAPTRNGATYLLLSGQM